MPAPFSGGCLCKAVRYEVSMEPVAVMNCHCRDCQYASGGGFTTAVVVMKDAFRVTDGAPKGYTSTGDSGSTVTRFFCGECGSPVYSTPEIQPVAVVKAGSLDDPSWLKLGGALYTKSAQPWSHIDADLMRFETMPPRG